jgi:hypothetical protein
LAAEWEKLPLTMQQAAMAAAVSQGSGGNPEPTQEQIQAQVYEPEAVRLWVWWLARDDQPALKLEELAAVITDKNVVQILADLARATKLDRAFPNSPGLTSSAPG